MVYLDESENGEITSEDTPGFKTLVIEKKPQTRAIKLKPVTNDADLGGKKEDRMRKPKDPETKMPQDTSGKKFPTRIPVINDKHTGIKGGKLRNILFFTYSHLLSFFNKGLVIEYDGYLILWISAPRDENFFSMPS
jgi:hypothetical protein